MRHYLYVYAYSLISISEFVFISVIKVKLQKHTMTEAWWKNKYNTLLTPNIYEWFLKAAPAWLSRDCDYILSEPPLACFKVLFCLYPQVHFAAPSARLR